MRSIAFKKSENELLFGWTGKEEEIDFTAARKSQSENHDICRITTFVLKLLQLWPSRPQENNSRAFKVLAFALCGRKFEVVWSKKRH